MIRELTGAYVLETAGTTYAFRLTETSHLEHLYYGPRIHTDNDTILALSEEHVFAPGNTNPADMEKTFSLEDICLEMSSYGKGDVREPFLEIVHADGAWTSDFQFESASASRTGPKLTTLPCSYGEAETLTIRLRDNEYDLALDLNYHVYTDCDVITRTAVLHNESEKGVRIERLMSLQLDLSAGHPWRMTTFTGAWGREMCRTDIPVTSGKYINASYNGTSSNRANPFFMLSRPSATEDSGRVYGFNLVYSGNHYECCEMSGYGKLRLVSGINPDGFAWELEPGASFETPEAVMTCSDGGFNGMSQNMHGFVRKHIIRGPWRDKPRPILLNSWEACYFDISERKLLRLAKAGADAGVELFVIDDGWFGKRNNDTCSLGDWTPNRKKLPHGLEGIAAKVESLGLKCGIWVEPEMVNVDSKLYRAHPDWAVEIPGHPHTEGRNQRFLDFSREDVRAYIIDAMSRIFSTPGISYVKWDMNRTFTDYYSRKLSPEHQAEMSHRYICGLYQVLGELTKRFPEILFEGCASGGNRTDLGILCYFPQIWGSDNTDALCRAEIQNGYSYGYPLSAIGAHVSDVPNHQTLRRTPLSTRFNVAAFGVLGYECNIADMSAEARAEIAEQIALYKEWRDVFFHGSFYRGRSFTGTITGAPAAPVAGEAPANSNIMEWIVVSEDQSLAVGSLLQTLVVPNTQYQHFQARGLSPDARYHFTSIPHKVNVKDFGGLINAVAPIHIKPDSAAHDLVARFVKLDGESEDCTLTGDALMNCGVRLSAGFSGAGVDERIRCFQDFASRMYFMEKVE